MAQCPLYKKEQETRFKTCASLPPPIKWLLLNKDLTSADVLHDQSSGYCKHCYKILTSEDNVSFSLEKVHSHQMNPSDFCEIYVTTPITVSLLIVKVW